MERGYTVTIDPATYGLMIAATMGAVVLIVIDERIGIDTVIQNAKTRAASMPASFYRHLVGTPDPVDEDSIDPSDLFCPECGKGPMARPADVEQHRDANHQSDADEVGRTGAETQQVGQKDRDVWSRGDMVDDYDIDWDTDEDPDPEADIPQPQSTDRIERDKLEAFWRPILRLAERHGEVTITAQHHHGGLRGPHIAQRLKQDLKRIGRDDQYAVSVGEPSIVRHTA